MILDEISSQLFFLWICCRCDFFELLHISSCITQRWFEMNISERDRNMAKFCRSACPVCKHARKKQSGLAYRFVKNVEDGLCPFCKAYERVHGKKSHEPTWWIWELILTIFCWIIVTVWFSRKVNSSTAICEVTVYLIHPVPVIFEFQLKVNSTTANIYRIAQAFNWLQPRLVIQCIYIILRRWLWLKNWFLTATVLRWL